MRRRELQCVTAQPPAEGQEVSQGGRRHRPVPRRGDPVDLPPRARAPRLLRRGHANSLDRPRVVQLPGAARPLQEDLPAQVGRAAGGARLHRQPHARRAGRAARPQRPLAQLLRASAERARARRSSSTLTAWRTPRTRRCSMTWAPRPPAPPDGGSPRTLQRWPSAPLSSSRRSPASRRATAPRAAQRRRTALSTTRRRTCSEHALYRTLVEMLGMLGCHHARSISARWEAESLVAAWRRSRSLCGEAAGAGTADLTSAS